ncbi:hypothetical protein VOLCADRAFT_100067 [Volvox carteri f. nagariensis]|uniref:GH16 domain-containing protein n=1 Tax=Volvox carteri f. nagariensis TaxID=3068 RepID=D8UJC2_VOLCA|nr:uncharacterized protein VOLCADRAFT_100067 [Volvox carteri f. nagariensis]EFJ40162.1 hypothetical protein VOLCADRAFT_100067 [Volvox carteri f. nagariensis]|eukprot:XP_002958772.1 hypothetical protein VOLCADRAFT_100067 [Volvox carteri f. nagariensis]
MLLSLSNTDWTVSAARAPKPTASPSPPPSSSPPPSPSPAPSPAPSPSPSAPPPSPAAPYSPEVCTSPTLLWSDEFDAATLDTSSWNYFTGTAYNNELEYYTSRPENVRLENGSLVIEARAEAYGGMNYTSARIDTRLKRAFYPGVSVNGTVVPKIRYEARMKLPKGQGMWPAFWLAPNSQVCDACGPYGSWPYSGEIYILEAINNMTYAFGTVHYGGFRSDGQTFNNQGHYRPTSFNLGLEWHTYAFEWSYNQMWWFIDDVLYYTTHSYFLSDEGWWTSSQTTTPTGPNSPFDAPFYIILNLAVGGDWPRAPDASTVFPSQLLVDYVRVLGYW